MEEHIEKLFQAVFDADDGSWCKDPEYENALFILSQFDFLMKKLHGPVAYRLSRYIMDANYVVERFHYRHYFQTGYLAAKKEAGGTKAAGEKPKKTE